MILCDMIFLILENKKGEKLLCLKKKFDIYCLKDILIVLIFKYKILYKLK